jgi:hypothetical protein
VDEAPLRNQGGWAGTMAVLLVAQLARLARVLDLARGSGTIRHLSSERLIRHVDYFRVARQPQSELFNFQQQNFCEPQVIAV